MGLDFDKMFKIATFCLRVNRSHPEITRNSKWGLQFALMHGIYTVMFSFLCYSIVFHDLKNKDIFHACTTAVVMVVYTVVTFQYSALLWYQRKFTGLIDSVKNDFEVAKKLPQVEKSLVQEYAERGRWVTKLWLVTSIVTGGVFPLKSIVLMAYYAYIGKFQFIPLYDLTYPAFVEDVKNTPIGFTILYIFWLYYDTYSVFMYIGFAPLGPLFVLHACGQLEVVKSRILNLFVNNYYNPVETRKNLAVIVKHLQNIYSFVDEIKESFRVLFEISMKTTAIILPVTLFQALETSRQGELSIEFITFIMGGVVLCFIPCYYSDLLLEKGEDVRQAVYMSGWEMHGDPQMRRTLLLILTRTLRPIGIRTVFRTVCLDGFSELCNQAYAIFNLLCAVWT